MQLHFQENPTLTVALALAAGMVGQALARHLRLPGIVLLLALGVVLGPDGLHLVEPASLGEGLHGVVGFAVAVILFEGGMSLDLRRLRREERAIRQLVLRGAVASLGAGTLLALLALGWEWQRSLLFGTLVVVTGPTVVTPLVRRLRVKKSVATALEAEGVFIDAVGAITAAVALELVLHPSGAGWALAAPTIAGRLLFGIALGALGGALLGLLLRFRNVVPEGLENPFTLAWAVLVFQLANAVIRESGIAAVTVAGLVVGNMRTHVRRELAEFKEQLTVLLIGLLFVLLAADVRLADVAALGVPGLVVAVGCIVFVRPLAVWFGTLGTELSAKERAFIGVIGPRGIVAAAVASLFGYELERAGLEGGTELRALTFLVIASSVLFAGTFGGLAARLLGLQRPEGAGWLLVGGNRLVRELAVQLRDAGAEVLCIDNDPQGVKAAEDAGVRALLGNALEARTTELAQLDTRMGALALTANEEVNFLFVEKARPKARGLRYGVGLTSLDQGVTPEMVHELGGEVLFGGSVDVSFWSQKLDRGQAELRWWRANGGRRELPRSEEPRPPYLPLLCRQRRTIEPITGATRFGRRSEIAVLVDLDAAVAAEAKLREAGFVPCDEAAR